MNCELTVLMPVHNCEPYLSQAIESVLSQTFSDFIFYIIDDGSSDNSASIISAFAKRDKRINFFQQDNQGLINTLNTHLQKVTTKYVARMDGDDVCLENRLEQQISFLKANQDIGIVGTGICYMDNELERIFYYSRFPISHNLISWTMLYKTAIGHANLMMKTELFSQSGGYNEAALHVEDYDFFLRMSKITKLANIKDVLYKYRKHNGSVSQKYQSVQRKNHFVFTKAYIETYLTAVPDNFVEFFKYDVIKRETNPQQIFSLLKRLYGSFLAKNNLSRMEKNYVKAEVERKMFVLAASYKRRNCLISIVYFWKYLFFKWCC